MLEKISQKLKNKKKKTLKDYFKKYKLYIYIFLASLLVFLIFILFKPIMFKSWLEYPLDLRAEIAFEYFKESFNEDCLGVCLEERQGLGKIIIINN